MPEITCKWCKAKYQAYNNNRKHCHRPECRSREIEENLLLLHNYFDILLQHRIVASVELRCPGNDSFGQQVKVTSECCLGNELKNRATIKKPAEIEIEYLITYFRAILQKELRGNFLIKTLADGTINRTIISESFSSFNWPVVLGNNILISQNIL